MGRKAKASVYTSPLIERLTKTQSDAAQQVAQAAGDAVTLGSLSARQWLERRPDLHIDEARQLQQRAAAAAVVVARRFREQELIRSEQTAPDIAQGFEALAKGPQYGNLFDENWAAMARPNAIEARTSPVAYLTMLYRRARSLEASGAPSPFRLKLDDRRPDIADEILDEQAFNAEIPTLSVSTRVLEFAISAYLKVLSGREDTAPDIDMAMSQVRYPMSMPYEHWATQIREILSLARGERLTLGEVARRVDPKYHYFVDQSMQSTWGDDAMLLSLPLGPNRRELLTAPYFTGTGTDESDTDFYLQTFGVNHLTELIDTSIFCARTHTASNALPQLFAVQTAAPVPSENVPGLPPASAAAFGAVYLNGAETPAIAIETLPPPETARRPVRADMPQINEEDDDTEPVNPPHYFTGLTPNRADRIHRIIRLSRWLELSYCETDRLIISAHIAQQSPGAPAITTNTLRALGVFKDFQMRYGVGAEDFAAWMSTLAPYSLSGDGPSQFDRVFNEPRLHSKPLVLDGGPIEWRSRMGQDPGAQAAQHIAVALGLSPDEFIYVARTLCATLGDRPLTRSLDVVSAFYRIASLARHLSISPTVFVGLLETLGQAGAPVVSQFAGTPRVQAIATLGDTDFLSALVAVEGCVRWCRDNGIDVAWMIQHLRAPSTPQIAGGPEQTLIRSLKNQLATSRITPSVLFEAGIPESLQLSDPPEDPDEDLPAPITPDWLCQLSEVVDTDGIVLDGVSGTDVDFETSAAAIIRSAVEALFKGEMYECLDVGMRISGDDADGIPPGRVPLREQIVDTLISIVVRTRAAQRAIVQEHLGSYLGIAGELVLPLVDWAGQSVYEILGWAWKAIPEPTLQTARRQIDAILTWPASLHASRDVNRFEASEVMLYQLSELRRQAEIVVHFSLDGAMLAQHAQHYRQEESRERDAFGFAPGGKTLRDFYYLRTYRDIVERGHCAPADLLAYLALVNTPGVIDEEGLEAHEGYARLMRDAAAGHVASLIGVGARDVLDAAMIVSPYGIVRRLSDFAGLLRVLHLSQITGLSVIALDRLGRLAEGSGTAEYRQAVQDALACLSASDEEHGADAAEVTPEVGQGATSTCTVSKQLLVANWDDASGEDDNEARFALTIRDLSGEPLAGVPVRWSQSGVGVIDADSATTDADGVARLTLYPGLTMGMAYVFATLGLDQRIALPAVRVDCDEATVNLHDMDPPGEALAGEREIMPLSVYLDDLHDNRVIGREIRWEVTDGPGRLLRTSSFTDRNGVAQTSLVSRETGTVAVIARFGSGSANVLFTGLRFVDKAYVSGDYGIRPVTPLLANQAITVRCQVLSLTGRPAPDETVSWIVDGEPASTSKSDANGFASLDLSALGVSTIVVTASVHGRSVQSQFDIVDGPLATPITPKDQKFIEDAQRLAFVGVRVEASQFPGSGDPGSKRPPISDLPVTWTFPGNETATALTDLAGHSRAPVSLAVPGTHTIKAAPADLAPVEFSISVVAAPAWIITLDGAEITDLLSLRVGDTGVLRIKPASGHEHLVGEHVLLTWEGANPTGQGLLATPSYMQIREMSSAGLEWTLDCRREPSESARFAIGIRLVDPRHVRWINVRIAPASAA
ncbi:hypothetical protein UC34_11610 [Pandoraea vervacti]|uniref:Big-1 domain-containing protein n=1 Tax=Pandoraea vervacti TaxID=656178 RepID=A0ABN4FPV2_9BURK|nr:Tc toxin subunit A [Pandoraea vervacti]AJP57495.1 hypothetical protein UC34_11610 [Pandoraea vervacti]